MSAQLLETTYCKLLSFVQISLELSFIFLQKIYWVLLHVICRCNNVLYLRGVPEDEDIEDADRD